MDWSPQSRAGTKSLLVLSQCQQAAIAVIAMRVCTISASASLLQALLLLWRAPLMESFWHAYNKTLYDDMVNRPRDGSSSSSGGSSGCVDIVTATRPLSNDEAAQKKIWPGVTDEQGESVYGFKDALERVWDSQYKRNCSDAKYLVSGGWPFGFGSRMHVEGYGLAIAMEMDRIYLPHPAGDNIFWETSVPHCQDRRAQNLECFYEPWSSCSIGDALKGTNLDSYKTIHICDVQDAFTSSKARSAIIAQYSDYRVLNIVYTRGPNKPFYPQTLIPRSLKPILHCSPMNTTAYYYWWRAISVSFLVRPNQPTISLLKALGTLSYNRKTDFCIALFVRHGDKGIEMNLVDLNEYLGVADFIFNLSKRNATIAGRDINAKVNDAVFITTDDNVTLRDVTEWGKRSDRKIFFTNLFDRSEQTFSLTWDKQHQKGYKAVHDKYEYISMLLNLEYALRCDAWVCTLASNSCRIIDELRATIGGKAGNLYADISQETCAHKPCLGSGIYNWGE